jgi:hypothetical protein
MLHGRKDRGKRADVAFPDDDPSTRRLTRCDPISQRGDPTGDPSAVTLLLERCTPVYQSHAVRSGATWALTTGYSPLPSAPAPREPGCRRTIQRCRFPHASSHRFHVAGVSPPAARGQRGSRRARQLWYPRTREGRSQLVGRVRLAIRQRYTSPRRQRSRCDRLRLLPSFAANADTSVCCTTRFRLAAVPANERFAKPSITSGAPAHDRIHSQAARGRAPWRLSASPRLAAAAGKPQLGADRCPQTLRGPDKQVGYLCCIGRKIGIYRHFPDGRYWARTSDLLLVRRAIAPVWKGRFACSRGLFGPSGSPAAGLAIHGVSRRFGQRAAVCCPFAPFSRWPRQRTPRWPRAGPCCAPRWR